jgi:hypothetical protein
MGKTRRNDVEEDEPATKRGRQAGAKTYEKPTLYKIINQIKPINTLLWGIFSEQYRVEYGELEAQPAATIKKFFIQKTCNSMNNPTGSSGLDDFTQKCQYI